MTGILCGHRAGRLIYEEAELMANVIPELLPCKGFDQKNSHHIYDVLGHIAAAIDSIRAAAGSTEHVSHEDEEQAKKSCVLPLCSMISESLAALPWTTKERGIFMTTPG